MTLVKLSDLSKSYSSQLAIDSLNLTLESGTVLGLLGPNGAGKSTCLKLLIGIMRATGGQAQVFGKDVITDGPAVRQQIGYVPDNPQLYPWMTVAEIMRFASGIYANWNTSLADDLCRTFELPKDRRIKHLSRGMKVKAALLVALAHRPRLLVLDEPMSGLDPLARDELMEIFVDVGRQETESIIFSSHQIDDVTRIADEIAILNEGHLLVHQSVETLLLKTKRIEAVLVDGRLPDFELPHLIWQRLNRRQWSITVHPFDSCLISTLNASDAVSSTSVEDLSLEQIFKDWIRGSKAQC